VVFIGFSCLVDEIGHELTQWIRNAAVEGEHAYFERFKAETEAVTNGRTDETDGFLNGL
jgi:hypothetical protein